MTTWSQTISNPFTDFVKALTNAHGADVSKSTASEPPHDTYLYRFDLPAGTDGSKILFVASSVDCEKDDCPWTLFFQPNGGEYRKVKDAFALPSLAISSIENNGRFTYSVLSAASDKKELESFSVSAEGTVEATSRKLTPEEVNVLSDGLTERPADETLQKAFDEIDKFKKGLGTHHIEKIKLTDFQRDNDAAWKSVSDSVALSEQYRDPADGQPVATPSPTAAEDAE